jgi:hypothetical protein
MPWVFLLLAIIASISNSLDGDFKMKFGEGGKGIGWMLVFYFMWRMFTPVLLFILAAVTWTWGRSCP